LDTENPLFVNYQPPSKQSFGGPGQSDAPSFAERPYVDTSNMTEEEKDEYEYQEKRTEIKQLNTEAMDSGLRSLARIEDGLAILDNSKNMLRAQAEMLGNTEGHLVKSGKRIQSALSVLRVASELRF
jgi:hypothetical protein